MRPNRRPIAGCVAAERGGGVSRRRSASTPTILHIDAVEQGAKCKL